MRAYHNAATSLLYQAGKIVLQNMDRIDRVKVYSNETTQLTENSVAKSVEQSIITRIHELYPTHAVLSKYSGLTPAPLPEEHSSYTWVLDPLDGCDNFINGVPICAISLALFENKRCIMGFVYDPLLDRTFSAVLDSGALLDGKKIRSQKIHKDQKPLVALSCDVSISALEKEIASLFKNPVSVGQTRNLGCASLSLAYQAAGSFSIFYGRDIHVCTAAAAILIASEAGASIKKDQKSDLLIRKLLCTHSRINK